MSERTRQIQTQGGTDIAVTARTQTGKTAGDKRVGPTSRTQVTATGPQTIQRTTGPARRTAAEEAAAVANLTTEDLAITLTFTLRLKGTIPCKPLAL